MDLINSVPFMVLALFALLMVIIGVLFGSFKMPSKYYAQQEERRKLRVTRIENILTMQEINSNLDYDENAEEN